MKIYDRIKILVIGLQFPALCKKEFIGGCDIVKEMFEKGELKKLLEEKKVI